MAAGKQGSSGVVITYDDAPGGTPRTMTSHIREIGGVKVEAITQQSNPFGTSWEEHTPSGMAKTNDVTVHGSFDTTATTGPHVVFQVQSGDRDPQGLLRTFTFSPGDSKTFTSETRLLSYEVLGKNGNLTEYEAVIRFSGAGAWS
jgi:hypothetical protein